MTPWASVMTGFCFSLGDKKNPPANAGDPRDAGSISGLEKALEGGNGNPLQYFCWENPMDRERR